MSENLKKNHIVAIVKFDSTFHAYASEKDYWVLDHVAWRQAFIDAGYEVPPDTGHASRFGMGRVSEQNAVQFLEKMSQFAVSNEWLARSSDVDGFPVRPSLFVDFDAHSMHVMDLDSPAFEDYLPSPSWTVSYDDFRSMLPSHLREIFKDD